MRIRVNGQRMKLGSSETDRLLLQLLQPALDLLRLLRPGSPPLKRASRRGSRSMCLNLEGKGLVAQPNAQLRQKQEKLDLLKETLCVGGILCTDPVKAAERAMSILGSMNC